MSDDFPRPMGVTGPCPAEQYATAKEDPELLAVRALEALEEALCPRACPECGATRFYEDHDGAVGLARAAIDTIYGLPKGPVRDVLKVRFYALLYRGNPAMAADPAPSTTPLRRLLQRQRRKQGA